MERHRLLAVQSQGGAVSLQELRPGDSRVERQQTAFERVEHGPCEELHLDLTEGDLHVVVSWEIDNKD